MVEFSILRTYLEGSKYSNYNGMIYVFWGQLQKVTGIICLYKISSEYLHESGDDAKAETYDYTY